jgi:HPt (histidine-containing phosphotransfer) domain-containing protein
LSRTAKHLLEVTGALGRGETPAPPPAVEAAEWRLAAAAIGLSIAGVAAPIAVAMAVAANAQLWRPFAASALVALLVLAPAGVGLATALAGLRRIAGLMQQAGSEAEHAVLRVFAATMLFGYAIALAAVSRPGGMAADAVGVAAVGLVGAWCWLLCVILWPAAPPLRHYGAIALDIALLSVFLHFGGGAVAGWYPLYLLIVFYSGLRRGIGALWGSALAGGVGFVGVIASTEIWRQQPVLAAGLLVALVLLPTLVAGPIRALAAARSGAAAAAADRQRTLRLIADAVRSQPAAASAAQRSPSAASDILDLAALEAGRFVPPVETFELRAVITRSLAPWREAAAADGLALKWRIDPRLPNRVRGPAQAFARIVGRLAGHAIETTQLRMVRLAIDAAGGDTNRVRLRLRIDGAGGDAAGAEASLALRLVQNMVALMDGDFVIEPAIGSRVRLNATVGLMIEQSAAEPMLDLGRRPVLVATEDASLADALAELLARWNAEPLWVGDADAAVAELSVIEATSRAVVIADGRFHLLSALSLAHHAARLGAEAPFVLLAANDEQIDGLAEVDEGGLDGFVPLPVTGTLLANALQALPLAPEPTRRREAPSRPAAVPPSAAPSEPPPAPVEERITPIAAHPKFAPEVQAAVDSRVVDGLRALGGGPGFLREVIESFRADARQIMERVYQAVATSDPAAFARGLIALHRAAGPLGGAELCELAASLQRITASELRQHGAAHVQRLDAEIDRLAAALMEYLPASEVRRS